MNRYGTSSTGTPDWRAIAARGAAIRAPPPCARCHLPGNGGCSHQGASTTSIRVTHLTHQNPRRPGATSRTGAPCPAESGRPAAWVASSKLGVSDNGRRRRYPVTEMTSMLRPRDNGPTASASRWSTRTPRHSWPAYQPPVQSSTAPYGVRTVEVSQADVDNPVACDDLQPERRRIGRLHRVAQPLSDRHLVGFVGAAFVRARRAAASTRERGHGGGCLDGRPQQNAAADDGTGTQRGPAAEVGGSAAAAVGATRARRPAQSPRSRRQRAAAWSSHRSTGPVKPSACAMPVATTIRPQRPARSTCRGPAGARTGGAPGAR